MLYVNGQLAKEASCKYYPSGVDYDNNAIGCAIQSEYVGKRGEEKLMHHFCGVMSTLHFVEVSPKTRPSTHTLLERAHKQAEMEDLVPMLAYRREELRGLLKPEMDTLKDDGLNERVFLCVRPGIQGKTEPSRKQVYEFPKKGGKEMRDLPRTIETIYSDTRLLQQSPASDVYLNIDGTKCLLPILSYVERHDDSASAHTFA
jgi:hypothetical protein